MMIEEFMGILMKAQTDSIIFYLMQLHAIY